MKKAGIYLTVICLILSSCNSTGENQTNNAMHQNKLANTSSPYLQQHANNPVDWYPWGEEALQRARDEDKPIIVSIGYSSCHWCHVMERESFENDSIAAIMNEHFINIKVDREERPDIDQIYMDAVQAMGLNGGWPLNVFLTPEQKPFYGGTYFPPENWSRLLRSIQDAFTDRRDEIEKAAGDLTTALNTSDLLEFDLTANKTFTADQQEQMFDSLKQNFDVERGGTDRAPKFPMPSVWTWMLQYGTLAENEEALQQVEVTLSAMARGGIYDHAGGGFARYSTDTEWLVPHFEKMLYDNAQLLSLYAQAYQLNDNSLYREIIEGTVKWLEREMTGPEGGFYAALDADSDGEEGKFYVWSFEEFNEVTGENAALLAAYYDVSAEGNWEDVNILNRSVSDEQFAGENNLDASEWTGMRKEALGKLLTRREARTRPGLDNKYLTGWNAMMIIGLLDAFDALGNNEFLEMAVKNGEFLRENSLRDGKLYRTPPRGEAGIDGYLEDYAYTIAAFTELYERTFDETWIYDAEIITNYVIENFLDEKEDMFFYTDGQSHDLVVRKKELFDNVIPASNSVMATNLFVLGKILDKAAYSELSDRMISKMSGLVLQATYNMTNWAKLHLYRTYDMGEIVFAGDNALDMRHEFVKKYIPNKITMGTTTQSDLPLVKDKTMMNDRTTIYVCYNKTCRLPVTSVEEAYKQLR